MKRSAPVLALALVTLLGIASAFLTGCPDNPQQPASSGTAKPADSQAPPPPAPATGGGW
jgi:hypothetical protein